MSIIFTAFYPLMVAGILPSWCHRSPQPGWKHIALTADYSWTDDDTRATIDCLGFMADRGITSIAAVQPLHVAAWVEMLGGQVLVPTVRQRFAAVQHLFDWLVVAPVVPTNPAASVRGPAHIVRRGKIPMLDPHEARRLLDAIDFDTPVGLRDRALIGLIVQLRARRRVGATTRSRSTKWSGCRFERHRLLLR